MAWLYISKYGLDTAEKKIQKQLKRYVSHWGAKEKYNTTLTIAAVRVVNHFIQESSSKTFTEFLCEFPRLRDNFKALISSHYSFDIYESTEAKSRFLEPDLISFD